MVRPSSFFAEDWDTYGLDKSNEAAAGHELQNDNKVYEEFMDTVVSYLDKYIPVTK